MRRAIGYVRVSTEKQVQHSLSVAAQRERIISYCRLHGIELLDTLCDAGESAASLERRPEAVRALAFACSAQVDLIIYSLSRLFRNVVEGITEYAKLEGAGARLISLSESIDTSSANGWAAFVMRLFFDEFEVRQTRERTKNALGFKRDRGERISAEAMYGHRLVQAGVDGEGRALFVQEIDPAEQEVIRKILELKARRYTFNGIGEKLFREGITSRAGTRLSAKTIIKIIRRSERHAK